MGQISSRPAGLTEHPVGAGKGLDPSADRSRKPFDRLRCREVDETLDQCERVHRPVVNLHQEHALGSLKLLGPALFGDVLLRREMVEERAPVVEDRTNGSWFRKTDPSLR